MKNNFKILKNACVEAIREWISYHKEDVKGMSREDLREKLYDALWIDDSVTGNASGSYTFSSYDAELEPMEPEVTARMFHPVYTA